MDIATRSLVSLFFVVVSWVGGGTLSSLPAGGPQADTGVPSLSPEQSAQPAPSAPPSVGPGQSVAPGSPATDAAYLRLLATIPEPIRARCRQSGYTEAFPPEPGELATADCTISSGPDGEFVSYTLFDSPASMAAFQDIQLRGTTNLGGVSGPGCFAGPGADAWAGGQRFCYQLLTNDASVRWTHDALAIAAVATEDDGDWARLGKLWESAGPVAP
jgi:hypothetical protein